MEEGNFPLWKFSEFELLKRELISKNDIKNDIDEPDDALRYDGYYEFNIRFNNMLDVGVEIYVESEIYFNMVEDCSSMNEFYFFIKENINYLLRDDYLNEIINQINNK